jgi:hypothetical protein
VTVSETAPPDIHGAGRLIVFYTPAGVTASGTARTSGWDSRTTSCFYTPAGVTVSGTRACRTGSGTGRCFYTPAGVTVSGTLPRLRTLRPARTWLIRKGCLSEVREAESFCGHLRLRIRVALRHKHACVTLPSILAFPLVRSEVHLSGGTVNNQPNGEFSTWSIERLEAHAATLARGSKGLETVRVLAQSRVYHSDGDPHARLRWAKLSLTANQRVHGNSSWDRTRMLSQDFTLRTWIIEYLGPDDADADWNPEALAADSLAALTLDPGQAAAISKSWHALPVEQIAELRRHKILTAHLDTLIGYLQPGPATAQLSAWSQVRGRLP